MAGEVRLTNLVMNYSRIRGYSLERLAAEIGVSRQTMYNYMARPRQIRLDKWVAMMDALGVPKEERWV